VRGELEGPENAEVSFPPCPGSLKLKISQNGILRQFGLFLSKLRLAHSFEC
jgi:hypothetical protein